MSDLQAENPSGKTPRWNEDLIFSAMVEHVRRHLLVALATGPKDGRELKEIVRKSFPNTLKHLALLCKAGLVIKKENSSDGRKPFYALNPEIPPVVTDTLLILDFKDYLFRLPLDMKPLPIPEGKPIRPWPI